MTTVELAYSRSHVAVWVSGHRLPLLWLTSAVAWALVGVSEWQRRGRGGL